MDDLLFEALTPLGFRVRVSRSYWELIVTIKHPVMAGRESDVKETLEHPDEIRQSTSDAAVYLFYHYNAMSAQSAVPGAVGTPPRRRLERNLAL